MPSPNMKRSQAILRMPLDMVDVAVILHDGERFDGLLFVPPTEDIARLVSEGAPFVAVVRGGLEHFVSRTAIAGLGLPADRAPQLDEELGIQRQRSTIKLCCGTVITGELRWVGSDHKPRLAEALNTEARYLVVHATEATYLVMKPHIASVVEA
jgi:hypothetical protein